MFVIFQCNNQHYCFCQPSATSINDHKVIYAVFCLTDVYPDAKGNNPSLHYDNQ